MEGGHAICRTGISETQDCLQSPKWFSLKFYGDVVCEVLCVTECIGNIGKILEPLRKSKALHVRLFLS